MRCLLVCWLLWLGLGVVGGCLCLSWVISCLLVIRFMFLFLVRMCCVCWRFLVSLLKNRIVLLLLVWVMLGLLLFRCWRCGWIGLGCV